MTLRDTLEYTADLYDGVAGMAVGFPGRTRTAGSSGKPTSGAPKGHDHPLRAALVCCARHLAYCHHLLEDVGAPGDWWAPKQLGSWHKPWYGWLDLTVTATDDGDVITVQARPEWPVWTPEPSDLSVTPPDRIVWLTERVAAGVAWCDSYDLDVTEIARHVYSAQRSLRHVEKVRRIRRSGGESAWTDPMLRRVMACRACRQDGLCDEHLRDVRYAVEQGDLVVVEEWRGAGAPEDLLPDHRRCGHYPDCWRERDGRHRLCQPCRKGYVDDCRCAKEAA